MRSPLVLVVLDGWGLRPEREYNAIALAHTPVYDALVARYPHGQLVASGEAVGLPSGQMGNSEVGHMNLGAGRVVYQDLTRIDRSIRDGDFFTNPALVAAMDRCGGGRQALHLIGLVSDGGVHSHTRHLYALVQMASERKLPRVYIHVITDGRDTSPTGGRAYVGELEDVLRRAGTGRIASVSGRYYAMDRDKRWDRTRLAYDAIVRGLGVERARSSAEVIERSYAAGITDEFIKPSVIVDADDRAIGPMAAGDSVVFFNFRADRMRQLTRAIAFEDFDGFDRVEHPNVHCTTMTEYDQTHGLPIAFTTDQLTGSLAEVLQAQSVTNLRLAETEKYAHVTYFFNCGEERPYRGEERLLVPSPKVATYDLKPEMSAHGITDALVADIERRHHLAVICNYANADMVGHTGRLDAAIAAVETLDACLGRIAMAIQQTNGVLIVTADHGNAEQMWDSELNAPHTAHTSNPVPVILVDDQARGRRLRDGSLRDVAPTMLRLLGFEVAREMTGRSLIAE
jgi:2,3-bisphosphoglycerate-independent phosphoglycerate mutase